MKGEFQTSNLFLDIFEMKQSWCQVHNTVVMMLVQNPVGM